MPKKYLPNLKILSSADLQRTVTWPKAQFCELSVDNSGLSTAGHSCVLFFASKAAFVLGRCLKWAFHTNKLCWHCVTLVVLQYKYVSKRNLISTCWIFFKDLLIKIEKKTPRKTKNRFMGYMLTEYNLPSAPWELLADKTLGLFVGCTKLSASHDKMRKRVG